MRDLEFLRQAENDLLKVIKKYDKTNSGKCHTVSNLLAAYFNVHFNSEFIHYSTGEHGWIANNSFAFDYRQEKEKFILANTEVYKVDYIWGHKMELLGTTSLANKVTDPMNVNNFISYFNLNFENVDKKVIQAGYYTGLYRDLFR